jgi:murein DD-endopeptidase MepM/ murein hydrolase activator NlpD
MSVYKPLLLIMSLLCFTVAACQGDRPSPQVFAATLPPDDEFILTTPQPTSTPTHTAQPESSSTPEPTTAPQHTATPDEQQTAIELSASGEVENFTLRRPIAPEHVDYFDRTYGYGDTQIGNLPVHHGVDFPNPAGTPVLASADGVVIHAGDDSETQFGPMTYFYGSLVVIEHDFRTPEGETIYTLYGHLERVEVFAGQQVEAGHRIGLVGATGVAIGPHLHFEVRAGNAYDYGATRNPDLWLEPYQRFGTLAGRVVDGQGEPLMGVTVQVRQVSNGYTRYAYTYAAVSVNSSVLWDENFTLGDLPWGDHEVIVAVEGRRGFRDRITIIGGETTFVDIRLE